MALTKGDKEVIKDMIYEAMVDCGIAEPVNTTADPMLRRLFQARVLPYLKGCLGRTPAMGKVTPEDVAFMREKLGYSGE